MLNTNIDNYIQLSSRSQTVKRIFDLICVVPGIMMLSPLFMLIALGIKISDRGPVLFKQERIGINGKPFTMLKFRTMVVGAEKLGAQLTVGNDKRITGIGGILRKTKIDEFPQLFNVLFGEMTLVGPRPEVPRYVNQYTAEQKKVLELIPGITDPASIEFRNENEILADAHNLDAVYIHEIMPEKIRLNLEYARNASLLSDIHIIFQTIYKIFFR